LFSEIVTKNDAFISFNYDVIFESILLQKYGAINYYLDTDLVSENAYSREFLSGDIPFLKLHGSMNLYSCDGCDKYSLFDPPIAVDTENMNMGPLGNYKFACPDCEGGNLMCLFVPPGGGKSHSPSILSPAWRKAFNVLKNADEIVIVGLSFRDQDLHLRHLVCGALSDNRDVKVKYIGYACSPESNTRIMKILNCNSIEFIGGGFRKWISDTLDLTRFY